MALLSGHAHTPDVSFLWLLKDVFRPMQKPYTHCRLGQSGWKLHGGNGSGGVSQQLVECELAVCLGGQGQWHPGVYQKQCCQQE